MHYRYSYYPAPTPIVFQGTKKQLDRKLKNSGLTVLKGSRGSYVLGGYSYGEIHEFTDEYSTNPTRSVTPSKDMMRHRYGKERITENDYARLTKELNCGTILFECLRN